MIQNFINKGYEIVSFEEFANIYIVNTCTVTNMSDRKSRQILRRAKEINKNAVVVAIGCYAQVAKDELEKIKEIDLVLGNSNKKDIVNKIERFIKDNIKESENEIEKEFLEFGEVTYSEKTRAVIKIQDGCNNFCSYCIIPYARGRVRSRNPESILQEIKQIAKKDIKEIVITGIHIGSYGKDFTQKYELIDLLEEIDKIEGLKRIRLGSIEPNLITKNFVERLKKINKICNHFHLSLQSGCNDTLKRMNRKYTTEDFEKSVELLRNNFNDVVLTADVIVGFPGEDEKEFGQTKEFLEKINFYKMHVFKYSPRKGTVAANMKKQVDGNIKEERSKIILALSNKNEEEFFEKQIGNIVEVLFEEGNRGHTTNYLLIELKDEKVSENVLKKVNIIDFYTKKEEKIGIATLKM